jgi:hypothetical protein
MSRVADRPRPRALIYGAAIGGLGWLVLTVALEHLLTPELGPARHTISEYANGGGVAGPLMVAGFLAWAGSLAATAVLLSQEPLQRHVVVTRLLPDVLFALLLIAAAGAIVTALFPTQPGSVLPPAPLKSNSAQLHALGSNLIQLCFYPAALLSLMLPGPRWFPLVTVLLLLVAVAVGPALAVLGVDAPGARQRVQLAAGCGWQFSLLVAWRSTGRPGYLPDNGTRRSSRRTETSESPHPRRSSTLYR